MKCKHCGIRLIKFTNPDGYGSAKITGNRQKDFSCPVKNTHEPEDGSA